MSYKLATASPDMQVLSEVSESLANSSDLPDVMDGPQNNELLYF